MKLKWPWDHAEPAAHLDEVMEKDDKVDRLHNEAIRIAEENGFGRAVAKALAGKRKEDD